MIQWLASSPYALWVNQSYGWPLALTIHAFGNAIVVGFMAIIAMRLFIPGYSVQLAAESHSLHLDRGRVPGV